MHLTPRAWCFALVLVILQSGFGHAANKPEDSGKSSEGYLLRYQFRKDEVLKYQVEHDTSMITTKPQLVEKVKYESHDWKNYRVVSVDSTGTGTLEMVLERAKMSAQFGEAKPECFDSNHSEDCPSVYRHIRDIIGKPLARVRISTRGELIQTVPMLSPVVLEKANILKADGDDSENASQNFLIEFPEHPVKVGEGWTNTFKVKVRLSKYLAQPVTLQRSYELVEVKDQIATIKLHTDLITPIRDGTLLAQLIQMTPEGTMKFDMENGRLIERTLTVDKTEVGVIGGDSSMQAKSKREERFIGKNTEASDSK